MYIHFFKKKFCSLQLNKKNIDFYDSFGDIPKWNLLYARYYYRTKFRYSIFLQLLDFSTNTYKKSIVGK